MKIKLIRILVMGLPALLYVFLEKLEESLGDLLLWLDDHLPGN